MRILSTCTPFAIGTTLSALVVSVVSGSPLDILFLLNINLAFAGGCYFSDPDRKK